MCKNKKILITTLLTFMLTLSSLFDPINVKATTDDSLPKPEIVGKSAITMDLATGEIIYAKDIDKISYPASITKLMTALIFAENATKDDIIPFTESAKKQPEYSLSANYGPITVGDTLSGKDVMNALLLFSANDAAYMIGDYISGSTDKFIDLMNERAKKLGLKNTNFKNPNGLHDDDHYTTAYDLALMAKAMLDNPWIKETMATEKAQIQFINSNKRINIENRNKLLGKNDNIGGKTGYTIPAGRCLLSFYERDGRTIVGIVLNSEYGATDTQVFEDMDKIIDYSFASQKVDYKKSSEIITEVEASYRTFGFFGKKQTVKIPIKLNENITRYDNGIDPKDISLTVDTKDLNAWNIAGHNKLEVTFNDKSAVSKFTGSATISNLTLLKTNLVYYIVRIGGTIAILALIIFTIRTINFRKRRHRSFYGKRKSKIFK